MTLSRLTRQIDPRGHRFGAGLSVAILAVGFLTGSAIVIPMIGVALGVSAFLGMRWSILGRPWPYVRGALGIGAPRELESEFPPRFAQLLGFVGLGLATAFLVAGFGGAAWLVAGAVAALQTLLAATGYCLGCRLYFLRWWVPAIVARLFRRADAFVGATPLVMRTPD
jgi:hypothetical protein